MLIPEQLNTIGKRLQYFIRKCYETQLTFAKAISVEPKTVNRYVTGMFNPRTDILKKFYNFGLSINWLLFFEGSMFSNNQCGRNLRDTYADCPTPDSMNKTHRIILNWIIENFNSLKEFSIVSKIEFETLKSTLESMTPLTPNFLNILHENGLNTNWLITSEGNCYAKNSNGYQLKLKKEGIIISIEDIKLIENIHEIDFNQIKLEKLKSILNPKSNN